MTFAEWLKVERKRARLTQQRLADIAGLGRTYVITLEKGHVNLPQFETRARIHKALGTSEQDLIDAGVIRIEDQVIGLEAMQAISNIEARRDPLLADALAILHRLDARRLGVAVQFLQILDERP